MATYQGFRDVLGNLDWPYGPNVHEECRGRLLDWARGYGLRLAKPPAAIDRFLGVSRSLDPLKDRVSLELDHVTYWADGVGPALVLSQPYYPGRHAVDASLTEARRLRLVFAADPGWYFPGRTAGLMFWRPDAWERYVVRLTR